MVGKADTRSDEAARPRVPRRITPGLQYQERRRPPIAIVAERESPRGVAAAVQRPRCSDPTGGWYWPKIRGRCWIQRFLEEAVRRGLREIAALREAWLRTGITAGA